MHRVLFLTFVFAGPAAAEPRLDPHGDPLPEGALIRFGTVRYRVGLGNGPRAFALSPDGKTFAAKSLVGVALFDVESGRLTAEFAIRDSEPNVQTYQLRYSPDGKHLVRLTGQRVQVLNAVTGRSIAELDLTGRTGVGGIAFVPGTTKFVLTDDRGASTFDVTTKKSIGRVVLESRANFVRPAGRICVGQVERDWCLFDLASGRIRARVPQAPSPDGNRSREEWALTPDGRQICFGTDFGRFRVVEVESGKVIVDQTNAPPPNCRRFVDVAISPDGSVAHVAGPPGEVRRWDLKAHKWLAPLSNVPSFSKVFPHPDGRHLLVADGVLRRYDLRTLRELPGPEGYADSVNATPSPDGKHVAVVAGFGGSGTHLELRELGGRLAWKVRLGADSRAPRWSPDGQWLVHSENDDRFRVLRVRNAATGKVRITLGHPDHNDHVGQSAHFTPDSRQVITPLESGRFVATYDLRTGLCSSIIEPDGFQAIDVSPDGRVVLFACGDDGHRLFDRIGDRYLSDWTGKMDTETFARRETEARFSPDGTYLFTWESAPSPSAALPLLATIRDPLTGRRRAAFDVGKDWVAASTLSPDGQWLAYGTREGDLHLWDVAAGQRLGKWSGHRDMIWSVGFAGMGRVVTGSDDMTALVWDLRPKERPRKPLWEALSGTDAVEAYRAIWALSADPAGPDLLRSKVQPVRPPRPEQVRQWLAELESERFAVRETATRELRRLGRLVEPDLRAARPTAAGEEIRTRLDGLLAGIVRERTPSERVNARAVTALELAGTDAATKVLADWAAGAPGARLTQDARAALSRLKARSPGH